MRPSSQYTASPRLAKGEIDYSIFVSSLLLTGMETVTRKPSERVQGIIDAYLSGLSQSDVSRRCGVTRQYVDQVLKNHNVARRKSASEKIIEAHSEGLNVKEITARVGSTEKTVRTVLNRAGLKPHPAISTKYWTCERVIEAIQECARETGRVPGADDFNPAAARAKGHHDRAERHAARGWPHLNSIIGGTRKGKASRSGVFDSWNEAVEAAGFEPRPAGRPASGRIDKDEIVRLRNEGLLYKEIAERVGCEPSYVGQVLKKRGLTQPRATAKGVRPAPTESDHDNHHDDVRTEADRLLARLLGSARNMLRHGHHCAEGNPRPQGEPVQ